MIYGNVWVRFYDGGVCESKQIFTTVLYIKSSGFYTLTFRINTDFFLYLLT